MWKPMGKERTGSLGYAKPVLALVDALHYMTDTIYLH